MRFSWDYLIHSKSHLHSLCFQDCFQLGGQCHRTPGGPASDGVWGAATGDRWQQRHSSCLHALHEVLQGEMGYCFLKQQVLKLGLVTDSLFIFIFADTVCSMKEEALTIIWISSTAICFSWTQSFILSALNRCIVFSSWQCFALIILKIHSFQFKGLL